MMKHLIPLLAALMLLCTVTPALADELPEVELILDRYRFTGPDAVQVTVRVTNNTGSDMSGPCALYDPTGRRIADFGTPTLKNGESAEWTGTWAVAEMQLRSERITFALIFAVPDGTGGLTTKALSYYSPITHAAEISYSDLIRIARQHIRHFICAFD